MRRTLILLALGVGLIAFGAAIGRRRAAPTAVAPGDSGTLAGICEASAVVPWEGGYLVGDNEGEEALYSFDAALAPRNPVVLPEPMEDIEALAPTPAGLWVVGSQSNNKRGEPRPGRARALILGHLSVQPDLSGCKACAAARRRPPKDGGLSVEGAASWRGNLWLGVRAPLVDGKAMLLRMGGDPTRDLGVAETVAVDLGGFGVRDLMVSGENLVVLAGPAGSGAELHRLYRLPAPDQAPVPLPVALPPHTEGVAPTPDGRLLFVTDGDGEPGSPCATPATWLRLAVSGI